MDVSYALTSPPGRRPQPVGYHTSFLHCAGYQLSVPAVTADREWKKVKATGLERQYIR